jgi:hypothetical protein
MAAVERLSDGLVAPSNSAQRVDVVTGEHTLDRAYKVPSLQNVAERAPYMDARGLVRSARSLQPCPRRGDRPQRTTAVPAEGPGTSSARSVLADPERPHRAQRDEGYALIRTVDLVVAGSGSAARVVAANALRHGGHVLVVLRSGDARLRRRFRRSFCNARNAGTGHVTMMMNAEVVCVHGVENAEAVVIRNARTGRLFAVNASPFVSCDGASSSGRREP